MIIKNLAKYKYNFQALEQLFDSMAQKGLVLQRFKGDKGYFEEQAPTEKSHRIIFKKDLQQFIDSYKQSENLELVCQNKTYKILIFEFMNSENSKIPASIQKDSIKKEIKFQTLKHILCTVALCTITDILLLQLLNGIGWLNAGIGAFFTIPILLFITGVSLIGMVDIGITASQNIRAYKNLHMPPIDINDFLNTSNQFFAKKHILILLSALLVFGFLVTLFPKFQYYYDDSLLKETPPVIDISQFIQIPGTSNRIKSNEILSLSRNHKEIFNLDQTLDYYKPNQKVGEIVYSVEFIRSTNSVEREAFYDTNKKEIDSFYLKDKSYDKINLPEMSGLSYLNEGYYLSLTKTEKSVMFLIINAKDMEPFDMNQILDQCKSFQTRAENQEILKSLYDYDAARL